MRPPVLAVSLALCLAPCATFAVEPPDAVIREIYAADASSINGTGAGVIGDKAARARFFSSSLLRAVEANEAGAAKRNEPPAIDGDPFTDAQESSLDDLRISIVSVAGAKAGVTAGFGRLDGTREQLTYSLILEKGHWRVDDIAYARADQPPRTLRGMLGGK
jgi:Protein of unknown function (DUF3828)